MRRKTYEQAKAFEQSRSKAGRHLCSHAVQAKNGNAEFVADATGFTQKMIHQRGENVWPVGGAGIITSLSNADFVDEIILSIHSMILGRGVLLFKGLDERHGLKLVDSKMYPSRFEQLHYTVIHA